MFCNQCEQTAKGTGCTVMGVCGKLAPVADLQDHVIYALRLLSRTALKARAKGVIEQDTDDFTVRALFSTLTNVNFDPAALEEVAREAIRRRKALATKLGCTPDTCDAAVDADWESIRKVQAGTDRFSDDVNVRSAMQLLLYGLKGVAAYADHAAVLGQRDPELNAFVYEALAAGMPDKDGTPDKARSLEDWLDLVLRCGKANLKAMELLDAGNTKAFGDPVPTQVSLGHRQGKAILVSGHDLEDLYELLKQTQGTGINIYTHGEMLPAHGYPELKKYAHLKGNFGTAWQNQQREFADIPAPVLFTTNCLMPPKASYADRVFTTAVVSYPELTHIGEDKDFTPVIEKALELGGYNEDKPFTGINGGGTVMTGFGHGAVLGVADQVIEAVKSGAIRHFFLVGGCDGARPGRNYYTEFVKQTPADTVVLTLACGKYRFNDLDLGTIGGLPRLMDVGQCNDAYGAVKIALALAEAFGCGVNDLPLSMVLSWYEQKAVCILLTLLYLGIKNIRLGPTLPAFVSPNVLNYLVENFGIAPITTPEEDLKQLLK
mgnify:CR=1 FL=1